MSARQNALYRGGLLVSAGAVLGGIGLAALLAFLALYLRKKKKEGWQIPTIPHPEMVLRGLISFGLPVPWRL